MVGKRKKRRKINSTKYDFLVTEKNEKIEKRKGTYKKGKKETKRKRGIINRLEKIFKKGGRDRILCITQIIIRNEKIRESKLRRKIISNDSTKYAFLVTEKN